MCIEFFHWKIARLVFIGKLQNGAKKSFCSFHVCCVLLIRFRRILSRIVRNLKKTILDALISEKEDNIHLTIPYAVKEDAPSYNEAKEVRIKNENSHLYVL